LSAKKNSALMASNSTASVRPVTNPANSPLARMRDHGPLTRFERVFA
jgi:hypothetical protein